MIILIMSIFRPYPLDMLVSTFRSSGFRTTSILMDEVITSNKVCICVYVSVCLCVCMHVCMHTGSLQVVWLVWTPSVQYQTGKQQLLLCYPIHISSWFVCSSHVP